jgi:hypothetical protein
MQSFVIKSCFIRYIALIFIYCISVQVNHAQKRPPENDTTKAIVTPGKKQATRAAIMSAVVPGMGQIYNKQYWKVPILYAGFGTIIFFISDNNIKYEQFKEAFAHYDSPGPYRSEFLKSPRYEGIPKDQLGEILKKNKDAFRRYRDSNIIVLLLVYLVNIIDASVDANFQHYDISRDLSLQVKPAILNQSTYNFASNNNYIGLRCSISF